VAAARGEEAWVVGDGRSTVQQLINQQINSDPRRGTEEASPLNRIENDPAVALELNRQGSAIDAIPASGERLLIQRNGNVAFDCTDEVHPAIIAQAALAARIVGLDIAGIDLVARNISQPLASQQGAIVEVNAGPGLLMHLKPASGQPRPVGEAIVDYLFPPDAATRIPVVGVTGSAVATLTASWLDHVLRLTNQVTGLACKEVVFLGTLPLATQNLSPLTAAQTLLINRQTEVAVIENSIDDLLNEGLAYDRCQVGIVTTLNPDQDPSSLRPDHYIDTPERLFNIVRTQVDVVLPNGCAVLNAADPLVREMAELCDGEVIFFADENTADTNTLAALTAHRTQGGRAVLLRNQAVILAEANNEKSLLTLTEISHINTAVKVFADNKKVGAGETAANRITALLATIGAAWALNVPLVTLRIGLTTF